MPWHNDPIVSPAQRLQNFLAPAPNTQYGDLLPLARGPDASLRFAMPNIMRDSLQSWARLMNVPYGGNVYPQDILATGTGGSLGAGLLEKSAVRGAAKAGEGAASRSRRMYNAPERPPRPFEADYPNGAATNAQGRLTHDIEGRPLNDSAYTAGRRRLGGDDEAVRPEEFDTLGKEISGAYPKSNPLRGSRDQGIIGAYVKTPIHASEFDALAPYEQDRFPANTGFWRQILIRKGLSPEDADAVLAHELGHAISDRVGDPPLSRTTKTSSLSPFNDIPVPPNEIQEFRRIYGDLNGGKQPEDFGYKAQDVNSELVAESLRAYLTTPNYIKSDAPNAAATIRHFVNPHPEMSKIIQFNSAPVIPVAPATPWERDRIVSPAKKTYVSPFANWFGSPEV